jgi:hypothetical protein
MHGSDGANGSLLRPHPIFGERKKERKKERTHTHIIEEREIDGISFPK